MGICGSAKNNSENKGKPQLMFVVGGPGAGKGTQCARIVEKYGFVHLSTGDLLRAEVASGSEQGKELQKVMSEGGLVTTATLLTLVENAMRAKGWEKSKFMLDGFPRNKENLTVFGEMLMDKVHMLGTLWYQLDSETMSARCLGRGEGRADDNEATIKKRLATYENETQPILEEMQKSGGKMMVVDASKSKDEVTAATVTAMDGLMGKKAAPAKKDASADKPQVWFIVGGPGSGKGTQCANLVKKYGFVHLSTGDLLRAEVASGSEKGKQLDAVMKEGGLVTTSDLLVLVDKAMKEAGWGKAKFLLDGFPRNQENVDTWMSTFCDRVAVQAVLYFDLDNETMTERLMGRNEGRADDNEATIKKRLMTFVNETKPTVKKLHDMNNVHRVSSKDSKENVLAAVCTIVDRIMAGDNKPQNPALDTYLGDEPAMEAPKEVAPEPEAPQEEAPAPEPEATPEEAPAPEPEATPEEAPAE